MKISSFVPRGALLGVLLIGACLAGNVHSALADRVRKFDAEIRVEHDGTLDVKETINVDFEGAQRHGIYRKIPVVYSRNGGKYTLVFDLKSVTDENGREYEYRDGREGRNERIRIGDPDETVTGVHTYVLHYCVQRAINVFGEAAEVYWNVTGNEWDYPIDAATAHLYPPPGVKTAQMRTTSFQGPLDSKTPALVIPGQDSIQFSAYGLQKGSGLTLVASMPAKALALPTALQNLWWVVRDWLPAVVLPLLAAALMTQLWWRKGRDEAVLGAIGVEWSPPRELSPAEVGTLIDETCDIGDVLSTLVDLAARGYLRIEEIPSSSGLFGSKKDYRFILLPEPTGPQVPPLAEHEVLFLNGLLSFADNGVVQLSALRNKFYSKLPPIEKAIGRALVTKGLFRTDPSEVRGFYYTMGVLLIFATFGLGLFIANKAWALGMGISGCIVFGAAGAMPARTARGVELLRHCLSFQRFVTLAERERLRVLAVEDPTVFGRLLPYAMALGVADQWAKAFNDLAISPPDWYVSSDPFTTTVFVHSLSSGVGTMGQTFSSQPSSSSSGGSGGSGFSGGGSGGGFGGGGGGSW